jgi:hypothetical protein
LLQRGEAATFLTLNAAPTPLPVQIDKWVCFAILVGMAFFYRAVFFLTLKWREIRSK